MPGKLIEAGCFRAAENVKWHGTAQQDDKMNIVWLVCFLDLQHHDAGGTCACAREAHLWTHVSTVWWVLGRLVVLAAGSIHPFSVQFM